MRGDRNGAAMIDRAPLRTALVFTALVFGAFASDLACCSPDVRNYGRHGPLSVKLAIISDIHSNIEALTAAFGVIDAEDVDAIYCLGDLVGYGADAALCVDFVRARCDGVVRGNHDEAVANDAPEAVSWLPRAAQKAVKHNREQLNDDQLDYLATLPMTLEADGCTFVHATPQEPAAWQRLDSFVVAQQQFEHFGTDVCFIGHSHVPAVMGNRLGLTRVEQGNRYLINVGSVGQPRDGDPRACVGFFDTDSFAYELMRVAYNVQQTAGKILASGLPRSLAKRLTVGS